MPPHWQPEVNQSNNSFSKLIVSAYDYEVAGDIDDVEKEVMALVNNFADVKLSDFFLPNVKIYVPEESDKAFNYTMRYYSDTKDINKKIDDEIHQYILDNDYHNNNIAMAMKNPAYAKLRETFDLSFAPEDWEEH